MPMQRAEGWCLYSAPRRGRVSRRRNMRMDGEMPEALRRGRVSCRCSMRKGSVNTRSTAAESKLPVKNGDDGHTVKKMTEVRKVMKQKLPIDISKIAPEDKIKYEMAKELGLYDQVIQHGWGSLSAKQTGKIGGMIAGKRRKSPKGDNHSEEKSVESTPDTGGEA